MLLKFVSLMNTTSEQPFQFKQFKIYQDRCTMKIGTDGILLGAWADVTNAKTALDIGTGTGLIAIMLGQRMPEASIHAVEIEEIACAQARENMQQAPWNDRLEIFHTSIQEHAKSYSDTYDLIISNPPFFSGGTFSNNQDKASVRHTIKLPHGDLLAAARKLLSDQGRFCVILPYIEGLRFQELAASYHLYATKIMEVKTRVAKPVERLLMQFERVEKPVEQESLVIQNAGEDDWTDAYVALTKSFYLYM